MRYQEQIQFAIMPRVFRGIRMCYKGEYSLKFQLVHQSYNGTKISAYPYIFKGDTSQQKSNEQQDNSIFQKDENLTESEIRKKKQNKGGTTFISNSQGYFQTSHFQVIFENDVKFLHQLCVFKLECKPNAKNQRQEKIKKIYLIMQLQIHKQVSEQKKPNSIIETKKVIRSVFTKKIYLNRSHQQLNKMIQVDIADGDYFSTVSMFIGSVNMGWKLRNNKMNLCQFLSMDTVQKQKYVEISKEKNYLKDPVQISKIIRDCLRGNVDTIIEYYFMTVCKSFQQIIRLHVVSEQFIKMCKNDVFQLPQQMQNFIQNVKSKIHQKQSLSQLFLQQDFHLHDPSTLFYWIHEENNNLTLNVKFMWQRLLKIIKQIRGRQFQELCLNCTNQDELKWEKVALKFISTNLDEVRKTQTIQMNYIRNSSDIRYSLNSKRTEQKDTILQIRPQQIKVFKYNRNQTIKKSQIIEQDFESHPYMIFQNFSKNVLNSFHRDPKSVSLVVFIHGFKGNQFDLEIASEYLQKYNQNVQILRIKTLIPQNQHLIQDMARTTALQIKRFIENALTKIQSISIIGYSLGGIIGRALLQHLSEFKQKMNIYVSFSSPHLGTYATENSLVKVGIWYMTKVTKCKVLEQLHTHKDSKTATKSYMKMLSEHTGISWFKKVVLVSCQEDQFVPHLSSRIQKTTSATENIYQIQTNGNDEVIDKLQKVKSYQQRQKKNIQSQFYSQMMQMSENILKNSKKVQRVQVWFDNENKKGTLDKLTGRQSHIEFLDNRIFLKWFFKIYGQQF